MTARKTSELKSALQKKGFRKANSHHEIYILYHGDKKSSVRTRISHGAREYDEGLLAQMAKQVKLNRSMFDDLIDCPLSGEEYIEFLLKNGHIR